MNSTKSTKRGIPDKYEESKIWDKLESLIEAVRLMGHTMEQGTLHSRGEVWKWKVKKQK